MVCWRKIMTKSWTELLGVPQGNETTYHKDIIRLTNYFTLGDFGARRPVYEVIYQCQTPDRAKVCFDEWMAENK